MKDGRKERTVYQEKTEERLGCNEPKSLDMESEAEHREFSKDMPQWKPEKRRVSGTGTGI
jgi:hypothetical protein